MPKGKGTYGSQVGRPPKKSKYKYGGNVDPFSTRNPEGVPAEQLGEMMENQNMANEGLPTVNAQDRSQVSPDTEQYKDGGKVKKTVGKVFTNEKDITDVIKAVEKKRKKEKAKADEVFKEHTLFGRQFKKGVG
jgi:C1A family cysteine protease